MLSRVLEMCGNFVWKITKRVMTATVIATAISDEIASVAVMHGCSMQPTLEPGGDSMFGFVKGDLLFVDKTSGHAFSFSRGDVVVFRSPEEPNTLMVKRLIGIEGDWVRIEGVRRHQDIIQIPRGHCWVEGDNISFSFDSRIMGPIPFALLKGTVTHILWPPQRFGKVMNAHPTGKLMLQQD